MSSVNMWLDVQFNLTKRKCCSGDIFLCICYAKQHHPPPWFVWV